MPYNGLNVGRDVVVDVIGPSGNLVTFSLVTGFESKQQTTRNIVKGLDGINRPQELPEGWEFTLEVERANSVVDDFFAQLEESYYAGQNILAGTITETIAEVSGGVSQYRFEGCVFKLDDAGSWRGDKSVNMKISGYASRRRKVS